MAREALYILVRADIPVADQAVQAGHAVAEWCKRWQFQGNQEWNNQVLVYLRIKDIPHLIYWERRISLYGQDYCLFCEPDMAGQATTIACYCTGEIFKSLPVWKP